MLGVVYGLPGTILHELEFPPISVIVFGAVFGAVYGAHAGCPPEPAVVINNCPELD